MKIKVFTTGGSIDKTYSTLTSNFIVGEPQVGMIFREANVASEFEVEPLLEKDSLDITPTDRQKIVDAVKAASAQYILITHGTDTMAETGRALTGIPRKTIVLTGAMRPAAFRDSDAPFNLGAAVIALQTLPEGVYVVMNGQVFDPQKTAKNIRENKFERLP